MCFSFTKELASEVENARKIENIAKIGGMRSFIKKARQFRANAKDGKQQEIVKFGVMR